MNPITDGIVGTVGGLVKDVLDRVLPDPELKAKAQAQAFDMIANGTFADKASQALALAQIDTNKTEAQAGAYRGGWRPFIGWTCGAALAVQFVAGPLLEWGCAAAGHPVPPLPKLDAVLWQLLAGMLGLGTLRTVEKLKGGA